MIPAIKTLISNLKDFGFEYYGIYYGKYRGIITDNDDPEKMGRLKIKVPTLFGDQVLSWAYPQAIYAGNNVGFFAIPPIGSGVYVEFESGKPAKPLWTGFWWAKDELPDTDNYPNKLFLRKGDNYIEIDNSNDQIKINSSGPVIINAEGNSEININGNLIADVSGTIDIGTAGGGVITTLTHPIDFVSGAPIIGSATVKAKS